MNAAPPTWRAVRQPKHKGFGRIRLWARLDIRGPGQWAGNAYRRQSAWEDPILSSLAQGAFTGCLGMRRIITPLAFLSPAAVLVPSPHKAHLGRALFTWR